MILLQGHSLTPASNVADEALSITLNERESTATWTPVNMAGIGVNSWVKSQGGPADGIVWRVQSIRQAYATATPTVQLEHSIKALDDKILFGEITPKEITGSSSASSCTARQAVEYILARQSDWTLGSFDFGSVSNPYKFNGDTLLDALEKVSDSLEGAWWSYDFSSYPFRLNITEKPEGEICEMRANRNLTSVTKTIDRSGMYTRFYPIGKDDLHIPGDYMSRNENLYGTVSKVEVDQSITTVAELQRWANERLRKHAEPVITVNADGMELSEATGQPLDDLTLGRICRIPLPEFSTTIEERITEISYPDLVFQPEVVRITMANQTEDLTKILADAIKRGGGGGRAAAVQDKVDHAWIEDTDEYVALIATDFEGLQASLVVTASQIRAEVADDVNNVYSVITQTSSQIRAEVNDTANGLNSAITQTASQIRAEVSDSNNSLSSAITQTASQIRSEVSDSVSGLHSQITQTASSIRSEVASSISSAYHSIIEQTDSHIRSEVGSAVSGIYTSVIEQTGSYIRSEIQSAASEITSSVIEQTGSYIRSEIQAAGSELYGSVILQTESYVRQVVGTKAQTYVMYEDPTTQPGAEVHDGDIWHESNGIETWNQLNELDWSEAYTYDWQEYLGGITHLRKNGEWVEISNEQAVALNTQGITETEKAIRIAKADADNNYAHFIVTASMIRSEVKNTRDGLSSLIEQTASQIRTEVTNSVSGLSSSITQTASQIRAEVNNSVNNLSSSITQTASQIRSEVSNTAAGLQSSITQNANQIELKVSKNGVISSINQTHESVTINASRINLTGYVTASQLSTVSGRIDNLVAGDSAFTRIVTAGLRATSFTFAGSSISKKSVTIDGTTIHYLEW